MPFIRLSDNYIDHPKFLALSADAFRLWHEGMAFARKHQTDGILPTSSVRGFRYYKGKAVIELASPYQPEAWPLWETIEALGYKIHDYLYWNLSKEEEQKDRGAATERMRKFRKARGDAVTSSEQTCHIVRTSGERSPIVQGGVRDAFVLDRTGQEKDVLVLGKGAGENPVPDARSKRPIFTGQRLTVFEWQLDDCSRTLGDHADGFDLHTWFFRLDDEAVAHGVVVPKRDGGAWLQARLVEEAQRRGIALRLASAAPQAGKLTTRLATALANIQQEAGDDVKRLR